MYTLDLAARCPEHNRGGHRGLHTRVYRMINVRRAEHYRWGEKCDGWHLVRGADMSVIEERMPAGAAEIAHWYRHSRQFFYVLVGQLVVEVDGICHQLGAGDGMEIAPQELHKVWNESQEDVRFLVVSVPPSHGDRSPAPPEYRSTRRP